MCRRELLVCISIRDVKFVNSTHRHRKKRLLTRDMMNRTTCLRSFCFFSLVFCIRLSVIHSLKMKGRNILSNERKSQIRLLRHGTVRQKGEDSTAETLRTQATKSKIYLMEKKIHIVPRKLIRAKTPKTQGSNTKAKTKHQTRGIKQNIKPKEQVQEITQVSNTGE